MKIKDLIVDTTLQTNNLITPKGYTVVHSTGGTHGKTGYVKVASITVGGTYKNQPIVFDILQRARKGAISIAFKSTNSSDPDLDYIRSTGNVVGYIKKAATSK